MLKKIQVGFEINTGKEVSIPISHTVITGLTHASGKTTAVMGFIKRSGLKAIIIKTKIGEKAITEGTIIPPFYKETFDWEYASELLEASRKEKLKFERSWIIKYSKTATNLLEFKRNIDNALTEGKLRELDKSVLISLQAYLEKILPELQYAPLSKTLDIREGINIMDLERFKEETQAIIIRSVLDEVLKNEKNILICIPECWKWLPERLSSPVKRSAEAFIRQGATNNNFLLLDSQDITGISKSILKQVSNWILGYQREINEIERTLVQIPLPKKSRPKSEDIATLKLGQFYVATSEFAKKVYTQPSWLDDDTAIKVSKGEVDVSELKQPTHIAPYEIIPQKQEIEKEKTPHPLYSADIKKINELRNDFISNRNDFFTKFQQINETISAIYNELYKLKNQQQPQLNEDEVVMRVIQKIPVNNAPAVQINEEEIVEKVLARVPKTPGSAIYEVAPLEKIRKDFMEEAKNKVISDIKILDDEQKKILKFVETQMKGCNQTMILSKCLFVSATSGGTRSRVSQKCKDMANAEIMRMDKNAVCYSYLKERIKILLGTHQASDQEIEQIYSHIMMEML